MKDEARAEGPECSVELAGVTKQFGEVAALAGIDLRIRRGEFFSLLGPSGCGKTTLLRIIAGLEMPTSGLVKIVGQDMDGVPAHMRPTNTVFQSYALFPHLNVWNNVAFGLRMKHVPPSEIKRRVEEAMEMTEISSLAKRHPNQISGGQKQRVALARALVNEPEVLLLDEPLGALDLKLRRQLQEELRQLQQRLRRTFIYVTHDQDEAMIMSDRIAVMEAGRIRQLGSGADLYERPATMFVAQFLGACNLLPAVVRERLAGGLQAETALGCFSVKDEKLNGHWHAGQRVTLAIRPEKIILSENGSYVNALKAQVTGRTFTGAETHFTLACAGTPLRATVANTRSARLPFDAGQECTATLPPDSIVVLEDA